MSIVNTLALESNRQIKINFDGGDLSSDAGLLLIKEFISKLGIDTLLEKAFKTNDPVFKSVLEKDALASQPTIVYLGNYFPIKMGRRKPPNLFGDLEA